MRDAIHNRYMLLPYFYTLFREANTTGVPVMRPLWMEFPGDEAAFNNDEAFMVGNSILVQGVYSEVLVILLTKWFSVLIFCWDNCLRVPLSQNICISVCKNILIRDSMDVLYKSLHFCPRYLHFEHRRQTRLLSLRLHAVSQNICIPEGKYFQ